MTTRACFVRVGLSTVFLASLCLGRAPVHAQTSFFTNGVPEEEGVDGEALAELTRRIAEWVQEDAIVGGEILVIKNDRILLHEAVGLRDRARALPMETGGIHHVASMTKPFTGTAVLQLIGRGLIALDQPVFEILPSFDRPATRSITVRHLLSHTAGWANEGPFPGEFIRSKPNLRALVDSTVVRGPPYAPAERFRYGDAHTWMLGAIIEAVSGMPAERYIEERVVEPLGLSDTRMGFRSEPGWMERVNPRYREEDDGWVQYWKPADGDDRPYFNAAGGAYATALDYAAWLRYWMELVRGDADSSPLEVPLPLAREALWGGRLHADYGFHWDFQGQEPLIFGHGGSDGTDAWAIPSENLIVVFMSQSRWHSMMGEVVPVALELVAPDLRLRLRVPQLPFDSLDFEPRPATREEATPVLGEYLSEGDRIDVVWEDGRLRMISDFWVSYDLVLDESGRFAMATRGLDGGWELAGPPVRLEFVSRAAGEVVMRLFDAETNETEWEATRVR